MWRFLQVVFLCIPVHLHAAVTFSEIAWMGSPESANHEWIELKNDGAAVDVSGWIIDDGMNLNIELEGVIPAGAYVVLERTSDATAPGDAFLIYTGSLVNTGATLTLSRSDGSVEDALAGGEGWQNIGGDNVTKETAQYASSGWFTGSPSPGAEGSPTIRVEKEDAEKEAVSTQRVERSERSSSVELSLPGVALQLEVDAPERGYVNQLIDFKADASGVGKTIIDSLRYDWNFGDASSGKRREVSHRYAYPGTYVVTVHAGFKRQEQLARHEITILPMNVSLTLNREGDVQVNNDSPYELDISGFRLVGEHEVTFPGYSIVLPNQTVTVPSERLGRTRERMVALYDELGNMMVMHVPEDLIDSSETSVTILPEPRTSSISVSRPSAIPSEIPSSEMLGSTFSISDGVESVTQVANASVASSAPLNERQSYTLLIVMVLLITLGIYLSPRRNHSD